MSNLQLMLLAKSTMELFPGPAWPFYATTELPGTGKKVTS
jgi:hypothetical protein